MNMGAALFLLALTAGQPAPKQQAPPQGQEEKGERPPSPPSAPPAILAPSSEAPPEVKKDIANHLAGDSLAERLLEPIVSNWPLIVVGILGVCAALRTLDTINRQASIMEQQTNVLTASTELARSQLELEHRPWVSADVSVASNLIFNEIGAMLTLNVTMKNAGRSVAKNVSLWTSFVIDGVDGLIQSHEKLCSVMKRPENEKSGYGWLLFPEQGVTESRPIIALQDGIKRGLETGPFKDIGAVSFHIIGCVDYQSTLDPKKHHQTRFVYLLGRVNSKTGMIMGTFDPNAPPEPIIITPTMHGMSAD
jgi:hypothetical protein